jgi:PIN domain nuclease of toxin-antitoxin system
VIQNYQPAAQLIENPHTVAFVSVVSMWEIAVKASIGKLQILTGFHDSLEDSLKSLRIQYSSF